jgi:pyruvate/2-oxoglutarate dehydrogenase complex dihydrolipoamide acyltransferase (E2) component
MAAATLAGVAAVFVFLHGGSAAARPSHAMPVESAMSGFTSDYVTADVRGRVIARMVRESARAAQRRHLAKLAAARRARRQAAQQQAAQQQAAAPPAPTPSAAPAPSSGGGDAASSPLGICIRNAEEGGSYAWGPGNGGGAYQFLLGTWEKYGGAASEYGVAGPAYQDQIFDNAIAAGGASNWTSYDGC